jgi:hypothetical protein
VYSTTALAERAPAHQDHLHFGYVLIPTGVVGTRDSSRQAKCIGIGARARVEPAGLAVGPACVPAGHVKDLNPRSALGCHVVPGTQVARGCPVPARRRVWRQRAGERVGRSRFVSQVAIAGVVSGVVRHELLEWQVRHQACERVAVQVENAQLFQRLDPIGDGAVQLHHDHQLCE